MSDRIEKNAILARSGVYQYTRGELSSLGLGDPPPWIGDKAVYRVYRPAPVIAVAVANGKFNRLPLTTPHPPEFVTKENFREYTVGWTGDTATMEYLSQLDEAVVRSTVTIGDAEAADAYESGVKELSHGYKANFRWRTPEEGDAYDAVMTEISDGNHMALVPKGRAGRVAAILDRKGAGVGMKQFLTGLFRYARMKAAAGRLTDRMVADEAEALELGFREGLLDLIDVRATLSEEEISNRVEEMKKLLADLPAGDERALLMRYMDDLKLMKGEEDEVLHQAENIICGLVGKLDHEILGEVEGEEAEDDKPGGTDCNEGGGMKDEKKVGGGTGEPKPPEEKPSAAEGKTTDDPPVNPEGKPAAAPAASPTAGEAPVAQAAAAHKSAVEWADELFDFLDQMRQDLEAQKTAAPGAAATPGATAAGEQEPETPGNQEPDAAVDAKSDPPPQTGVPVQKPDGSDKPGKPIGPESKHEAIDSVMATYTALVDPGEVTDAEASGGIDELYRKLKGGDR
jgi:hypothetical protein